MARRLGARPTRSAPEGQCTRASAAGWRTRGCSCRSAPRPRRGSMIEASRTQDAGSWGEHVLVEDLVDLFGRQEPAISGELGQGTEGILTHRSTFEVAVEGVLDQPGEGASLEGGPLFRAGPEGVVDDRADLLF